MLIGSIGNVKGICTESRVVDMPNLWNAIKSVEIQSIAFQDVCIEIYVKGYTKVYSTSVLLHIYIYILHICVCKKIVRHDAQNRVCKMFDAS